MHSAEGNIGDIPLLGKVKELMSSADNAPIRDQTLEMNSPPWSLTGMAVGPTVAGVATLAIADVASSADVARAASRP